jgi:hypothetical protein
MKLNPWTLETEHGTTMPYSSIESVTVNNLRTTVSVEVRTHGGVSYTVKSWGAKKIPARYLTSSNSEVVDPKSVKKILRKATALRDQIVENADWDLSSFFDDVVTETSA